MVGEAASGQVVRTNNPATVRPETVGLIGFIFRWQAGLTCTLAPFSQGSKNTSFFATFILSTQVFGDVEVSLLHANCQWLTSESKTSVQTI